MCASQRATPTVSSRFSPECWSDQTKTRLTWTSTFGTAKTVLTTQKSSSASHRTSTIWKWRWGFQSSSIRICGLCVGSDRGDNVCFILCHQPEKECNLNHTQLDCAVGYPFLGSNAEVSVSVQTRIYKVYTVRRVLFTSANLNVPCDLNPTGKFQNQIWGHSWAHQGGHWDQRDSYKVRCLNPTFNLFLSFALKICLCISANLAAVILPTVSCVCLFFFFFLPLPQWQWRAGFYPAWQHGAHLHPCEIWSWTHLLSVSSWTHCSSGARLFKNQVQYLSL